MRIRRLGLAIGIAALLGAVSGCAAPATSHNGALPRPSQANAPMARCQTAGLAAGQGEFVGAMGTAVVPIAITNDSAMPCVISGTPTVQLRASLTSSLPTQERDGPPKAWGLKVRVELVPLAAGESASFTVIYEDNPVVGQTCPSASGLEITLPGLPGFLWATTSIAPCGGVINVTPIRPGVQPVKVGS